jgi:hypothetical protein
MIMRIKRSDGIYMECVKSYSMVGIALQENEGMGGR